MKLIKYCTTHDSKLSRAVAVAFAILAIYFAGEAAGEFLYYITH